MPNMFGVLAVISNGAEVQTWYVERNEIHDLVSWAKDCYRKVNGVYFLSGDIEMRFSDGFLVKDLHIKFTVNKKDHD